MSDTPLRPDQIARWMTLEVPEGCPAESYLQLQEYRRRLPATVASLLASQDQAVWEHKHELANVMNNSLDGFTVQLRLCEELIDAKAKAVEALKPFADLGRELGDGVQEGIVWQDDLKIEGASAYNRGTDYFITVGDLRRAAKALKPEGKE